MTFMQYITRSTGLGRTAWGWAAIINFAAIAMIIGGAFPWYGHLWILFTGIAIAALFWIGTYSNWKTDRDHSDRHSNNHYPDVCENCQPVQMAAGGPITDIVWWVAATRGWTREEAAKRLAAWAMNGKETWSHVYKEHQHYLNTFKK